MNLEEQIAQLLARLVDLAFGKTGSEGESPTAPTQEHDPATAVAAAEATDAAGHPPVEGVVQDKHDDLAERGATEMRAAEPPAAIDMDGPPESRAVATSTRERAASHSLETADVSEMDRTPPETAQTADLATVNDQDDERPSDSDKTGVRSRLSPSLLAIARAAAMDAAHEEALRDDIARETAAGRPHDDSADADGIERAPVSSPRAVLSESMAPALPDLGSFDDDVTRTSLPPESTPPPSGPHVDSEVSPASGPAMADGFDSASDLEAAYAVDSGTMIEVASELDVTVVRSSGAIEVPSGAHESVHDGDMLWPGDDDRDAPASSLADASFGAVIDDALSI